jgi:hypothetical protein
MSRKYVPWCAQRTHTVQARTTFVAAGTPAGPTHKSPAVLDNLPLLSEDTTQIFVPTLQQPAPPPSPRFSRPSSDDLRCKNLATRQPPQHLRIFAPLLPAPSKAVTSPLHPPGEIVLEMSERRVLLARITEKRCVRCKRAVATPPSVQGSLQPPLRLAHSIIPC